MTDSVKGYIYKKDVRIKISILQTSLEQIAEKRGFSPQETKSFTPAALFAALYATEQKDDSGSVYISFKFPQEQKAYTAICETDGRLRGYSEEYIPGGALKDEVLFISGIRLALRGDYQSAVSAINLKAAISDFYKNSRQTKADFDLFSYNKHQILAIAEYLPGHDVNYRSGEKVLSDEDIQNKLKEAVSEAKTWIQTQSDNESSPLPEGFEAMFTLPVSFGCTCTKRKIKQALLSAGETNLDFPVNISCKFCGKEYTLESL